MKRYKNLQRLGIFVVVFILYLFFDSATVEAAKPRQYKTKTFYIHGLGDALSFDLIGVNDYNGDQANQNAGWAYGGSIYITREGTSVRVVMKNCDITDWTPYIQIGTSKYGHNATGWSTGHFGGTGVTGGSYEVHNLEDKWYDGSCLFYIGLGFGYDSVTATWTPWQHKIAYDANGGTGAPATHVKAYGTLGYVSNTIPTRAGYVFSHWICSAGGNYARGQAYGADYNGGTVTMKAIWTPNTYNQIVRVRVQQTDGTYGAYSNYINAKYVLGAKVTWSRAEDDTFHPLSHSSTVTGDQIHSYNLLRKTYTVFFNGNGHTGGSTAWQGFYRGQTKALMANGFTKLGYTFSGWNTKKNGSGTAYNNMQSVANLAVGGGIITLYAQWENNLGLVATITRKLAPHEPILKMAETGILTMHTTGYADKLTVSFSPILYPDKKYDIEYSLDGDEEFSSRESTFIIPLYCEEGEYTVEVTAFRGDDMYVKAYPAFEIRGTVLDDIRTRIRGN